MVPGYRQMRRRTSSSRKSKKKAVIALTRPPSPRKNNQGSPIGEPFSFSPAPASAEFIGKRRGMWGLGTPAANDPRVVGYGYDRPRFYIHPIDTHPAFAANGWEDSASIRCDRRLRAHRDPGQVGLGAAGLDVGLSTSAVSFSRTHVSAIAIASSRRRCRGQSCTCAGFGRFLIRRSDRRR